MRSLSVFMAVVGGVAVRCCPRCPLCSRKGEYTRANIRRYLREKGLVKDEDGLDDLVDRDRYRTFQEVILWGGPCIRGLDRTPGGRLVF